MLKRSLKMSRPVPMEELRREADEQSYPIITMLNFPKFILRTLGYDNDVVGKKTSKVAKLVPRMTPSQYLRGFKLHVNEYTVGVWSLTVVAYIDDIAGNGERLKETVCYHSGAAATREQLDAIFDELHRLGGERPIVNNRLKGPSEYKRVTGSEEDKSNPQWAAWSTVRELVVAELLDFGSVHVSRGAFTYLTGEGHECWSHRHGIHHKYLISPRILHEKLREQEGYQELINSRDALTEEEFVEHVAKLMAGFI